MASAADEDKLLRNMRRARPHIRQADDRDSKEAAELSAAAFVPLRAVYRPTREAVRRQHHRQRDETRIIAELGGRIVGTVEVDCHSDHLQLIGWAVHPDFQRKGIAYAMLDWIERHVRRDGHEAIVLATIRETGNVALFEGMGFEVVDEKEADWCVSESFEQLHDVKMAKKIA